MAPVTARKAARCERANPTAPAPRQKAAVKVLKKVEALPTADHDKYSYLPLFSEIPDDPWHSARPKIRLLHLLPGTGSEQLKCSLEISEPFGNPDPSNPSTRLSYEAISYVWGDATEKAQIICNGKVLQITASLATALRRVRLANRIRVLWADGVCINQQDLEERAYQVSLMAAIYSQAQQVLCWLGEDEGNHAFYFATRLSEKLQPRLDSA